METNGQHDEYGVNGIPFVFEQAGAWQPDLPQAEITAPGGAPEEPGEGLPRPGEPDAQTLETYHEANRSLRARVAGLGRWPTEERLQQIEGYVGHGAQQYVFTLDDGIIIKIPLYISEDAADVPNDELLNWSVVARVQRTYVTALERTKGHEGFEQIVTAFDMDDEKGGAVLCEPIPGKTWENMTPEERDAVPKDDFSQLIRLVGKIGGLGVRYDDLGASGNLMYDPEVRFTILDLDVANPENEPLPPDEAARDFARDVLFQFFQDGHTLLPVSARKFYAAYIETFGEAAGAALKTLWSRQQFVLPDDM